MKTVLPLTLEAEELVLCFRSPSTPLVSTTPGGAGGMIPTGVAGGCVVSPDVVPLPMTVTGWWTTSVAVGLTRMVLVLLLLGSGNGVGILVGGSSGTQPVTKFVQGSAI